MGAVNGSNMDDWGRRTSSKLLVDASYAVLIGSPSWEQTVIDPYYCSVHP